MATDFASGLTAPSERTVLKRTSTHPSPLLSKRGEERRAEPCKALLLKMLQPDEGTTGLQRTRWAAAKASGVNRPACALMCGPRGEAGLCNVQCFISVTMTKSNRAPSGCSLLGQQHHQLQTDSVYMVTQYLVPVSFGGLPPSFLKIYFNVT